MRIDERAPPDVHCGRRVTFKTILTTGPSRCGAGFKALLIIDEDECSPLDSVANRHETIPPKKGTIFSRHGRGVNSSDKNSSGKNDGCLSKALPVRMHSNRVSASRGPRFRETGFQGQRKMRRNDLPTVTMPSLTTNRRTDPRQFGAFRTPSGNLR